jgi:ABC-2 type transport system permease protein
VTAGAITTAPRPGRSPGKAAVAGAAELARLAGRRDRIMIPAWLYLLTAVVTATAYGLRALLKTEQARQQFAATAGVNPVFRVLYGHLFGDSIGALTAWRYGVYASLGAALMSMFLVIRHTRADEEAGRLELIGSAPVGRHAPLAASLLIAVGANVVLAALMELALVLLRLPATGTAAFAAAVAATGVAFAGVSACAAQLAETARMARGLVIAVLGASYVSQAVGNSVGGGGPGWLVWISPLGWPSPVEPFVANHWWVLAAPGGLALVTFTVAVWLARRRDHGSGLIATRSGPSAAAGWLRGPAGLAWRTERGALAAWVAGLGAAWGASGAVAKGLGSLLSASGPLRQALLRLGGEAALTNAYLAAIMNLAGMVVAGYVTSAVLRLRADETAGLADPLLAAPVSRTRWWAARVGAAGLGTAVVVAAAGVGAGLGYGLRTGDAGGQVTRLLGAATAQLPAVLAVGAAALLLVGVLPRAAAAGSWAVLGITIAIALLGPLLRLSHWLLDVSPFTHSPRLPGGPVAVAPLAWLSAITVVLAGTGLAGLRRRDIG